MLSASASTGWLITASGDDPSLATHMRRWLDEFVARLNDQFAKEFPNADPTDVAAVAAGVTGVYFNVEALYPLGDVKGLLAASKRAALILVRSLGAADD